MLVLVMLFMIEKAGKTIGLGEIVVVGENFGIKVTQNGLVSKFR